MIRHNAGRSVITSSYLPTPTVQLQIHNHTAFYLVEKWLMPDEMNTEQVPQRSFGNLSSVHVIHAPFHAIWTIPDQSSTVIPRLYNYWFSLLLRFAHHYLCLLWESDQWDRLLPIWTHRALPTFLRYSTQMHLTQLSKRKTKEQSELAIKNRLLKWIWSYHIDSNDANLSPTCHFPGK